LVFQKLPLKGLEYHLEYQVAWIASDVYGRQ